MFSRQNLSNAPQHNPYDKFTQDEFDAWIGGITGALKRALGQEEPTVPTETSTEQAHYSYSSDEEEVERIVVADGDSSSEEAEDSFPYSVAPRVSKGKERDPRDGPGFGKGCQDEPILIGSDSEFEEDSEEEVREEEELEEQWDSPSEHDDEEQELSWDEAESSAQAQQRRENRPISPMSAEEQEDTEDYDEGEEEEEEDYLEGEMLNDATDTLMQASSPVLIIDSDDDNEADGMTSRERTPDEDASEGESSSDGDPKLVHLLFDRVGPPRHRTKRQHPIPNEQTKTSTYRDVQPLDDDTSFPPHDVAVESEKEQPVELSDLWSGPKTYAEDYYSGGDAFTTSPRTTADIIGDENDIERHILFSGEQGSWEQNEEEAEEEEDKELVHPDEDGDEVQPLTEDTSFPPKPTSDDGAESHQPLEIPDLWVGPRMFAQDFYSGGDVHIDQNDMLDPHHLGDNDDSAIPTPILSQDIFLEDDENPLPKSPELSNATADSIDTVYEYPPIDSSSDDPSVYHEEDYRNSAEPGIGYDDTNPIVVDDSDDDDVTLKPRNEGTETESLIDHDEEEPFNTESLPMQDLQGPLFENTESDHHLPEPMEADDLQPLIRDRSPDIVSHGEPMWTPALMVEVPLDDGTSITKVSATAETEQASIETERQEDSLDKTLEVQPIDNNDEVEQTGDVTPIEGYSLTELQGEEKTEDVQLNNDTSLAISTALDSTQPEEIGVSESGEETQNTDDSASLAISTAVDSMQREKFDVSMPGKEYTEDAQLDNITSLPISAAMDSTQPEEIGVSEAGEESADHSASLPISTAVDSMQQEKIDVSMPGEDYTENAQLDNITSLPISTAADSMQPDEIGVSVILSRETSVNDGQDNLGIDPNFISCDIPVTARTEEGDIPEKGLEERETVDTKSGDTDSFSGIQAEQPIAMELVGANISMEAIPRSPSIYEDFPDRPVPESLQEPVQTVVTDPSQVAIEAVDVFIDEPESKSPSLSPSRGDAIFSSHNIVTPPSPPELEVVDTNAEQSLYVVSPTLKSHSKSQEGTIKVTAPDPLDLASPATSGSGSLSAPPVEQNGSSPDTPSLSWVSPPSYANPPLTSFPNTMTMHEMAREPVLLADPYPASLSTPDYPTYDSFFSMLRQSRSDEKGAIPANKIEQDRSANDAEYQHNGEQFSTIDTNIASLAGPSSSTQPPVSQILSPTLEESAPEKLDEATKPFSSDSQHAAERGVASKTQQPRQALFIVFSIR
ncbi:hypothetical protein H0H93_015342 [Arthromyces matolae]|nr:hypothetical protein H0H93_015342 [Arthromyces matolae]